MAPQVAREHYETGYDTLPRLHSYAEQIHETLRLRARRVVEIGVGTGFLTRALRAYGIEVIAVDFDPALRPDIVASVDALPLGDASVDAVLCFEVLEHLPFDRVPVALHEMRRVASRHVLFSVPDCRSAFHFRVSRGWSHVRKWERVVSNFPPRRPQPHAFDGQHYWEIGKAETPEFRVLDAIEKAGLTVDRHHRLASNPYHHMFQLSK